MAEVITAPAAAHPATVFADWRVLVVGLLLAAVGLADTWVFNQRFGAGWDLGFVTSGFTAALGNGAFALGLKVPTP